MTINDIIKKYYIELDSSYKRMIDKRVAEQGIEEYLNRQLVYLDCSRIINNMRMMQTIGYPYKQEISSYVYALSGMAEYPDDEQKWVNKLIERHISNIEYEKENPPIWYEKKSKKSGTRKRKVKEGDMFSEEDKKPKISKAEAKLKAKLLGVSISFGTFKIKNK